MLDSKKPVETGYFDGRGSPCLKLHVCGVRHQLPGVEYKGVIDTGFTGFLQLPLSVAINLSLPLEGTREMILADHSVLSVLTAFAQVTLAGKSKFGVAALSKTSKEILIGMDFLKQFNLALTVSKEAGIILLEDQSSSDDETAE